MPKMPLAVGAVGSTSSPMVHENQTRSSLVVEGSSLVGVEASVPSGVHQVCGIEVRAWEVVVPMAKQWVGVAPG